MAAVDYEALEAELDIERKKVDVATVSFSVREIVRMHAEGELRIDPSYQRKYRWRDDGASRFIESVFLGLPIPPIFVATNDDFQWEVVDGLQRVSTLIRFISDDEAQIESLGKKGVLKLEGLSKLSQLEGTTFKEMPVAIQRYFSRQPLQVVSLTDKSDKAVRFDLFERLNSGAISLSAQEVRTSVYRGPFIDFLEELSGNSDFKSLVKLQEKNQSDGTAEELVLKFFAYKNDAERFKGSVESFLNDYAEKADAAFDFVGERKLFESAFAFLAEVVEGPFVRPTTPVTPLVQLEACSVAIAQLLEEGITPVVPPENWITDEELVASSTRGSNTRSMLSRRLARARQLFSPAG